MKKNWFSRSVLLASVVAVGLSASPAWADHPVRFVPGVNTMGNLDDTLGAIIKIKATYNTRRGTMHAYGNGGVTNQSGRGNVFYDIPVVIPGMNVTSNQYRVFWGGGCTLRANGTLLVPST
jgi:hypothetical protein